VQGGYNDLLARRTAPELLASIQGIVARLAQRHIKAVLCGYYNSGWDAVGRSVARRYGAVFVVVMMGWESVTCTVRSSGLPGVRNSKRVR
jgi:hypothetical protein